LKIQKIDISPKIRALALNANVQSIFTVFDKYGFDLRIVGGAVRDILLDEKPRDIDFATTAAPTDVIYVLNELVKGNYNSVVAKGIMHGTVNIIYSEREVYEITSVAFSITEKEGTLETVRGSSWKDDAMSRDFTINSLQMTRDGLVYDHLGGLRDLKYQYIRFVKNYQEQIKNNHLIFYRFLKLISKFPSPKYDPDMISFIIQNRELLNSVKLSTKNWFFHSIRKQKYPENAFEIIKQVFV
jgi:tRNA nucleotidyltransferase/poly(A) polymerase